MCRCILSGKGIFAAALNILVLKGAWKYKACLYGMPENYMNVAKSSLPQPVNISVGQCLPHKFTYSSDYCHYCCCEYFYTTVNIISIAAQMLSAV